MSEVQEKPKTLAEEIMEFNKEINEMIETASQISQETKLRFDPALFLLWRNK